MLIQSGGRALTVAPSPQVRMREVVTELTRAYEDAAWINLSSDYRGETSETGYEDRRRRLQRIRMFRRRNPLAKQAAGLLQHYVIGQGISWKAENKKVVSRVVDEFWSNTVNQTVLTSHSAQKWFIDRCYTDGEFFLTLFPDTENGTVEMGYVDAMFVDDVISDRNNVLVPKWYKVRKTEATYDFQQHTWNPNVTSNEFVYYRDWRNTDPAPPGVVVPPGVIYHIIPERIGKRGESQLVSALDYLKAHSEFVGDRATINRAAAQVAWKKKRQAGANDVAAEVARLRSTLTSTVNSWEQNPAPASGATVVENSGSSLEWVTKNTGAEAAAADEKIMRMMVGSGLGGIPNHLFGDEASANLATATAMNTPLLKSYEDWQTFMRDIFVDVHDFVLTTANEAGRIPDRDDSRKFAEIVTTQQAVAQIADVETGNREAFAPPVPVDPSAAAGMRLVMQPKPGAGEGAQPVGIGGGEGKDGKVSWYVDVDFSPILQKDVQPYMMALESFQKMLPAENVESQKLVVELALVALNVNDTEETMSRLYPDDMVAVLVPKVPPMLNPGMGGPGVPGAGSSLAKPPTAPEDRKPKLSEADPVVSLAEHRTRRLLELAARVDAATAEG